MTSITDAEARGEYVAGLRALADLLEQHDEVPAAVPRAQHRTCDLHATSRDELIAAARAFPGKLDKKFDDDSPAFGFELHGKLRGLRVVIYGDRNDVCRRVVTGTREITETVPAPDAPTVEVTRTVEDVEWVCEPLLAEATK
jgi:hypothetical protein